MALSVQENRGSVKVRRTVGYPAWCGEQLAYCEPYFLIEEGTGDLAVSYEKSSLNSGPTRPERLHKQSGFKTKSTYNEEVEGRTSFFKEQPKGSSICSLGIFVKSGKLIMHDGRRKGTIIVKRIIVESWNPYKAKSRLLFRLACGTHRACDVDAEEKHVAQNVVL